MHRILGSIAILILCVPVLLTAAHAEPAPRPPRFPKILFDEWYTYRYNGSRTGVQPYASALSDPAKVGNLSVKWSFPGDGDTPTGGFNASPIVVNDTVFIGSTDGYFYALDAGGGAFKWRYPIEGFQPLVGSCAAFGGYGIQSSATYAKIGDQDAVIFGAPDPGAEGGLGSAQLFALNAQTGQTIWKAEGVHDGSEVVAHVSGCTSGNLSEHHERIANSSPLVVGNKVYVGVADTGDNPIQNGQVVAVDLNTGHIDSNFHYISTATRGGGMWNAPATDGEGVYFTTGNTRCDSVGCQSPEPTPNHGLSMIRVDKDTGIISWAFQPVPYNLDNDPDWAAGATVMSTSCGEMISSVQKDGWSYAVDAGNGAPGAPVMRWQFPPTGFGSSFLNAIHGNDGYRQPGAAWNDVFIVKTGGESLIHDGVMAGYGRLHALNTCAAAKETPVRWIADIPDTCLARPASDPCKKDANGNLLYPPQHSLGAPTVTGGIVFVGTDLGHLVVLGDPKFVFKAPDRFVFSAGSQCSNIDYTTPQACQAAGYAVVPSSKVLANIPMPDGGKLAGLRNEPALAKGRVFVGTLKGHVYMLDVTTETQAGPCIRLCGEQFGACSDCNPTVNPHCPTEIECGDSVRACINACNQNH